MAREEPADCAAPARDEAAAEAVFIGALEHAERYLELHEAACSSLKQGWFNIARARHAMGMHQVSQAMYKSQMDAQTWVHASADNLSSSGAQPSSKQSAASDQSTATTIGLRSDPAGDASSAPAAATGQNSTPAPHDESHAAGSAIEAVDEASTCAGGGVGSSAAKLEPQKQEQSGMDGSELRLVAGDTTEALRMFGAAPSPYLRTAQGDFQAALRQLVAVANQRQRLTNAQQLVLA